MKSGKIIEVRNATVRDIPKILKITDQAYEGWESYTKENIRGQIANFGDGCFVVIKDDEIIKKIRDSLAESASNSI